MRTKIFAIWNFYYIQYFILSYSVPQLVPLELNTFCFTTQYADGTVEIIDRLFYPGKGKVKVVPVL
jgi:hypothetical protein